MAQNQLRQSRSRLAALALALALLAGCTSITGTPGMDGAAGADGATGGTASSPSSVEPVDAPAPACVTEGYPCNIADVPFAVLEDSIELGGEAAALARIDGDVAAAEALVRGHADVVAVDVTHDAITFRVADGVPFNVWTGPTAVYGDDGESGDWDLPDSITGDGVGSADADAGEKNAGDADPGGTESPTESQEAPTEPPGLRGASNALRVHPAEYQPAGETGQNNDDGPERKAVVVEPYGSLSTVASGRDFVKVIESQASLGGVDYVGKVPMNLHPNVFDVMTSLDQYELIHISSHGWSGGVIGPQMTDDWFSAPDADGKRIMAVSLPDEVTYGVECFEDKFGNIKTPEFITKPIGKLLGRGASRCEVRIGFAADFFTAHYPGGLQKSLVFADWCQSAMSDGLRQAISGTEGGFVGWSDTVHLTTTALASVRFWQYMSTGADPLTVITKMHSEGLAVDRLLPEHAELRSSGHDLRIRDAVTSSTTDGARISSGSELPWSGVVDDGNPDTLDEISLYIEAVPAGEFDELAVKMWIDGEQVPISIGDFTAEIVPTGMEYWDDWKLTAKDVLLPFDVTTDRLGAQNAMPWRVEVSDDGSGESAHKVGAVYLQGAGIEVSHPTGLTRLAMQGDIVEVDGTEDDGKPGTAPIAITVTDVPAQDVPSYTVNVTLTGGTLNSSRVLSWPLSDFEPAGSGTYRKRAVISLDRDLTDANRLLIIDAQLFRDGDEVDAHAPTAELHGKQDTECFADVTITGSVVHQIDLRGAPDEFRPYAVSLSEHLEWPLGVAVLTSGEYAETFLIMSDTELETDLEGQDIFELTAFNIGKAVPAGETGTFTVDADIAYRDYSNAPWALLIANGDEALIPNDGYGQPLSALTVLYGEITLDITKNVINAHVLENWGRTTTGQIAGTMTGTFTDEGRRDRGSRLEVEATFEYSSGCGADDE